MTKQEITPDLLRGELRHVRLWIRYMRTMFEAAGSANKVLINIPSASQLGPPNPPMAGMLCIGGHRPTRSGQTCQCTCQEGKVQLTDVCDLLTGLDQQVEMISRKVGRLSPSAQKRSAGKKR